MGWQLGFLEAASDLEITQGEVTSLVGDMVNAAIQGIMVVGIMSMFVREFYGVFGEKKLAKQEEVLEMVEELW